MVIQGKERTISKYYRVIIVQGNKEHYYKINRLHHKKLDECRNFKKRLTRTLHMWRAFDWFYEWIDPCFLTCEFSLISMYIYISFIKWPCTCTTVFKFKLSKLLSDYPKLHGRKNKSIYFTVTYLF